MRPTERGLETQREGTEARQKGTETRENWKDKKRGNRVMELEDLEGSLGQKEGRQLVTASLTQLCAGRGGGGGSRWQRCPVTGSASS